MKNSDPRIAKYLTPYRYPEPVMWGSGEPGAFDEKAVDIPFVFEHQGRYQMLYTGFDGQGYQSALAESDDLLHWRKKGVILAKTPGSGRFDAMSIMGSWIVKESDNLYDTPRLRKIDGKYWMTYSAYPGAGYEEGAAEIGLAWCDDESLLTWHPLDTPIHSWRGGADWEHGGLYRSCLLEHDGLWYLFYNAKNLTEGSWIEQTGCATSPDMKNWTRHPENPLLRVSPGRWDGRFVSEPCIVRDGDLWLNFYFGFNGGHAMDGLAVSTDLIHWDKAEEPILTSGAPGSLDEGHAHKASMFYKDGRLWHFYCATRPWREGDPTKIYNEFRTIAVASDQTFV